MPIDMTTIDKALLTARPAKEGKNILSPIARLSFPVLFSPKAAGGKNAKPDADKKFSLSLLIPPECDIDMLKKAAGDAAMAEWGSKAKDMKIKSPFLKAEDYKYEGYIAGWRLIRASSKTKPKVVEARNGVIEPVTEDDAEIVYPGRWCTVSLNPFTYDNTGNKGVTFGLNNVMLLHHDDSLGGRMSAEDEFEAPGGDFGVTGGNVSVDSLF